MGIAEMISQLPAAEQAKLFEDVAQYKGALTREKAQVDFMAFVKEMWPGFIHGRHHVLMAKKFQEIADGKLKRLIINMPPRHTKSEFASNMLPAWFLGKFPEKKVIQCSNTAELAVGFGRKVRNLVGSEQYSKIFPNVSLRADSKAAGRWATSHGGDYFAIGVGGTVTGKGADLLIIDDPHSEQDLLAGNFAALETAYKWFTFGARTRLMPGGRVAIVATRWHKSDLIGRLVKDMGMNEESDQYEVVEFPAILSENNEDEKALWPEFFDLEALKRTRASMPAYQWNAQYQQNPTGDTSAVCKREWWRIWEGEEPPKCEYIIQALDAAAELKNTSDFTSITTWGVFWNDAESANQIILLNSVRARLEFPELKEKALEEYSYWEPDSLLVEKKSNGTPLYQELRRMGIPAVDYTPHRGTMDSPNSKFARLNSVVDIIKSGMVWVPNTRWAEQLVEELAEFPYGDHDDTVDTTLMALTRFRQGGFLRLPSDQADEPLNHGYRKSGYY